MVEAGEKRADDVKAKMVAGSFDIFVGPLKDNKAKRVIPAGKTMNRPTLIWKDELPGGRRRRRDGLPSDCRATGLKRDTVLDVALPVAVDAARRAKCGCSPVRLATRRRELVELWGARRSRAFGDLVRFPPGFRTRCSAPRR